MNSNKLFCIVFITMWALLIILNLLIKSPEFSETENRSLATIPSFSFKGLVEGTYASGLDNYINDHFVFRDIFLKTKSTSEMLTFKKENNPCLLFPDG